MTEQKPLPSVDKLEIKEPESTSPSPSEGLKGFMADTAQDSNINGIKKDSDDELRSNIEQTITVYQTLRRMRDNSPTAWAALLDDVVAAIQSYANRARLDERRLARKDVEKQRPIFLTKDDVSPLFDDPMAEKVVKIRDQLRREILVDFDDRETQLAPKEVDKDG